MMIIIYIVLAFMLAVFCKYYFFPWVKLQLTLRAVRRGLERIKKRIPEEDKQFMTDMIENISEAIKKEKL